MLARPTPDTEIRALVERLFCGDAPYGEYVAVVGIGEVVIPGVVYRFTMRAHDKQLVSLQLFHGIKTLGGALWTREVRALLRASSRQHPALPAILAGAYIEDHDLAFVITHAEARRLSELGPTALILTNRVEALRQLTILGQGLSLLHEQGIVHRNLHPGSVECIADPDYPERLTLRLCRFEMSAMISNLLRRRLPGQSLGGDALRQLYLGWDGADEALPYCPPERAEWLLANGTVHPENDRADVFAFGVLAWRWLVESKATALPEPNRDFAGITALHGHMRRVLHERVNLPSKLRALLLAMLSEAPMARPRMHDVMDVLAANFGAFVSSLAPQYEAGRYYVGFMPVESRKTLFKWGWLGEDPSSKHGRELLREFLIDELRGARLMYRPDGFASYQEPRDEREQKAFAAARYVLRGNSAFWFCDLYFQHGLTTGVEDRWVDELLLIKYVVSHQRASRLDDATLSRGVPDGLELIPVWADQTLDVADIRATGESWMPLLRSIEHAVPVPEWKRVTESALNFLLDYQSAALDAKTFPYRLVPDTEEPGGTVTVTLDTERDRTFQFGQSVRSLYFDELRPAMGRLYEGLDGPRSASLALYDDKDGRPDYSAGFVAKVLFRARLDDHSIQLRMMRQDRRGLPERGWIRPEEDFGSHMQHRRQSAAVKELLGAHTLLEQLHAPVAIRGIRARWEGVGDNLFGRSADIVKDMLGCEPFYALHGPPGSGKTTVAAVAVAAALRADPSQRILVSSQSHYALDNLGVRILKLCEAHDVPEHDAQGDDADVRDPLGDLVAVRVASDYAFAGDKVHRQMERRQPEQLASAVVRGIQRACTAALATGRISLGPPLNDATRAVLVEWKDLAPRVELELRDRIRRGANLVFATTGACSDERVTAAGIDGMYDWVIVEEAARAWPTELAQPLVRGLRWTLIGDHFQLPAFDELAIQRFLDLCRNSSQPELARHGANAADYHAVFRLFGNLFDGRADRRKKRPRVMQLMEPLDELDVQFRMHEDICRIVSRAFYRERIDPNTGELTHYVDGWLKTHPSANRMHDQHTPPVLAGRSVAWFDTTDVTDSADQRSWRNPGEVEVIRRLLDKLRPVPPAGEEAFAILTPYNAQREDLLAAPLPGWVAGRIYTIDSFQGREADVVIVSMVRSVERHPQRPETNIGHLVSPNRVNVLLSRARRLLIVVGRIDHFAAQAQIDRSRADLRFWQTVVDEFRALDAVLSARSVLGEGASW